MTETVLSELAAGLVLFVFLVDANQREERKTMTRQEALSKLWEPVE